MVERSRQAESLGFDEFWVIEDCFFTSGPALAAAALTATERIGVGIGIMPAVARNPAITAMEIATLAQLAPGRFHAGIGHGMQDWMAQIGARPSSPLTVLDETITVVRRLLAGERVRVDGRFVTLDDVALAAPPTPAPLVSAGVRSPRSLQLAGRVADGTILAELCSPTYLRWARDHIVTGAASVDRADRTHRLTVFVSMSVGIDGDAAREAAAGFVAEILAHPHVGLTMLEFYPELAARAERIGWYEAVAAMPREWWHQLGAFGTPEDAAVYYRSMIEAGAQALTTFPSPSDPSGDASLLAEVVLPLVG